MIAFDHNEESDKMILLYVEKQISRRYISSRVPVIHNDEQDSLCWKPSTSGYFNQESSLLLGGCYDMHYQQQKQRFKDNYMHKKRYYINKCHQLRHNRS
ncbi:hypothetical protein PR202_ga16704 [Eleusine coracana subsp. coracana]|uniref:Uncharacterized protein n=1 Tax=Eleusine coracana subsp. coracana TaxID=191504 RepID=A0AAV5CNJ8_ELECO|nr:hypothetical protein PR202_ga16704 [Eleusine coracana subsp. coracana]